jgi:hypothetical protein
VETIAGEEKATLPEGRTVGGKDGLQTKKEQNKEIHK